MFNKILSSYSFALIFIIVLPACKKSETAPLPEFTAGLTVYMAGETNGSAAYWKNGELITLDGRSIAKSIAVANQNVYVCGYTTENNKEAIYWKNSVKQTLANTLNSRASGIAVIGTDVYVSGEMNENTNPRAVYWKNGSPIDLAAYSYGHAYSIVSSGTDVYISGKIGKDIDTAICWKNGQVLRYYSIGNDATIGNISFVGTDLYAVGSTAKRATQFKNSDFNFISNETSFATGIAFMGSDAYVVGTITDGRGNPNAVYWKNGTVIPLASKYPISAANGIAVAGNDVYIVGTVFEDSKYKAVYWKNGIMQQLSPSGNIYCIVVVK